MDKARGSRDKRGAQRRLGARKSRRTGTVTMVAAIAGVLVVLGVLARVTQPGGGRVPTGPMGPDSPAEEMMAAARSGRISSFWRGGETLPVLDPARFRGQRFMGVDVEAGYRAAAEIPDVLDELFCYCFCENPRHSPTHKSLRSCFTDTHGTQCTVCLNEAMRARELVKKGLPLPEIERKIDAEFSKA